MLNERTDPAGLSSREQTEANRTEPHTYIHTACQSVSLRSARDPRLRFRAQCGLHSADRRRGHECSSSATAATPGAMNRRESGRPETAAATMRRCQFERLQRRCDGVNLSVCVEWMRGVRGVRGVRAANDRQLRSITDRRVLICTDSSPRPGPRLILIMKTAIIH